MWIEQEPQEEFSMKLEKKGYILKMHVPGITRNFQDLHRNSLACLQISVRNGTENWAVRPDDVGWWPCLSILIMYETHLGDTKKLP